MSTKPDKLNTSDQVFKATYQVAQSFCVGTQITKPAMTQHVRTVVTSAQSGSLPLRYAPHDPKVTDVNTSS
jgi:hypothetical protein